MSIRTEAARRYAIACGVVGWSRANDPGQDERDRITVAMRRMAFWLTSGTVNGIDIPANQIGEVAKLSGESIRRGLLAMRPYPGPVACEKVERCVAAYEAALAHTGRARPKALALGDVLGAYQSLHVRAKRAKAGARA